MKLFGHGKRDTNSPAPAERSLPQKDQSVSDTTATVVHSTATVAPTKAVKNDGNSLQSDQTTAVGTYKTMVDHRAQLEKRVNQLNQQYGDARNQLRSQLLNEKDYLRAQSRLINHDYDTQSKQRDVDFEQFSQLQEKRNKVAAQFKQLVADVNEGKQQFEHQQIILERLQGQAKQISQQRATLNKQEHELLTQINNQSNLTDLMDVIATKQKKIADINQQDHEFEQAEDGLKSDLVKQQAIVDDLSKRVTAQAKVAQDNDENKALQEQLVSIDTQLQKQQAKLSADDKQLGAIKQRKEALANQLQSLADRMNFYFSSTKLIDTFQFDPARHYVFFSNTLLPINQLTDRHGLEIIDQLFDKTTIKFDILTTDFNRELPEIWQSYQQQGMLSHAGNLINPYLDFQLETASAGHQPDVTLPLDQAQEWQVNEGTTDQPELIRSASGKQTVKLQYRADRSLESVKYFQNDQLFKMAIYDQKNTLLATQYVDPRDVQHAASEIYYRADHSVALEKVFFNDHVVVQTTDSGKTVERTFETENDYYAWWIKSHALKAAQDSLIIDITVPYFTSLLMDDDRQFELVPLITDAQDTALIERIVADDSPVNNIIVSDELVHEAVLKVLKRDMHIMVIDQQAAATAPVKSAKIKTRIYIPKVS